MAANSEQAITGRDVVAARMQELRKVRNWQPAQLADRCTESGFARLTEEIIQNIESGRRRKITVDELFAFAYAFKVPVFDLLPGRYPPTAADLGVDAVTVIL